MGNTPSTWSCMLQLAPVPGSPSSSASASCKVVHADGRVTRLARPVRASELMVDHPGQFVCDAGRLAVGCRVPGVAADELLQPRRAYLLLPMDMLYSVLTDEEVAALPGLRHGAAATPWKRIVATTARSNGHGRRRTSDAGNVVDGGVSAVKVFPLLGVLQLEEDGVAVAGARPAQHGHAAAAAVKTSSGGSGGMMRRRRWSWRPVLDTIEEVP